MKKMKPRSEKTEYTTNFYCPACDYFIGDSYGARKASKYTNYCPSCGKPLIWDNVEFGITWPKFHPVVQYGQVYRGYDEI